MIPAASGMFPGSVEITLCDLKIHVTPAQASALGRVLMKDGPEISLALFQAASDADAFSPTAAALRVRKACEVGR